MSVPLRSPAERADSLIASLRRLHGLVRSINAETLALLDTMVATAPVGLSFKDRELRYVRVNHAMAASTSGTVYVFGRTRSLPDTRDDWLAGRATCQPQPRRLTSVARRSSA